MSKYQKLIVQIIGALEAGINGLEISEMNMTRFRLLYEQLVDSIIKTNPNSKLYLESILPVNHKLQQNRPTNVKIEDANNVTSQIAREKNQNYIDLFKLYAGNTKELPDSMTSDGIHLKPSAYNIWYSAIKELICN